MNKLIKVEREVFVDSVSSRVADFKEKFLLRSFAVFNVALMRGNYETYQLYMFFLPAVEWTLV